MSSSQGSTSNLHATKQLIFGNKDDRKNDRRTNEEWHRDNGTTCQEMAAHVLAGGVHPLHEQVDASRWCITKTDLDFFQAEVMREWKAGRIPDDPDYPNPTHDDDNYGPSVHQVNKHYIKPTTLAAGGMSWALMRNREGHECDVFATHCWSEGIFEFIERVRSAWPVKGQYLYCCFLANPQNGSIADLLASDDPKDSPFGKALATAKYFIVIPNHRVSVYSRLWCVYEAHLAVRATVERDMHIVLPQQTSHRKLLMFAGPGALFFCISEVVTTYTLAPLYGKYLAPIEWLIVSYVLSWLLGLLAPCVTRRCCCELFGSRAKRNSSWVQLCLLGAGLGLARWHLRKADFLGNLANNTARADLVGSRVIQWEPGEGWALVPLFLSLTCAYIWNIMMSLNQKVIRKEGTNLNFTTVRDAGCSVKSDEDKIKSAIIGCEDEIDKTIEVLLLLGRYDKATASNIEAGMSPQRVRRGVNPFFIWCACIEWTYWWITDLSAAKHHVCAMEVMFGSISVATTCVYCFADSADRFIIAVDAFFWTGLLFVLISIWRESLIPGFDYQEQNQMAFGTIGLQIAFFLLAVAIVVYQYGGYRESYIPQAMELSAEERVREVSRRSGELPSSAIRLLDPISDEDSSSSDIEAGACAATATACATSADGLRAEFDDQEDTTDSEESVEADARSGSSSPMLSELSPRTPARAASRARPAQS